MTHTPEEFGDFTFYQPENEDDGWSLSHDGLWVPVILADRDACVLLSDLMIAGLADEKILSLRDTYNRADPPVNVTSKHIAKVSA